MFFFSLPKSVLQQSLKERKKNMAIVSLFLVATILTLCESYIPSPNHFVSCSYSDKVTFTLDKTFIYQQRQTINVQTISRDVTVVVLLQCAVRKVIQRLRTTRDVSEGIMQGLEISIKILLDKFSVDIAARMTAVRNGFTQGQLLFLRTPIRVKKAPA